MGVGVGEVRKRGRLGEPETRTLLAKWSELLMPSNNRVGWGGVGRQRVSDSERDSKHKIGIYIHPWITFSEQQYIRACRVRVSSKLYSSVFISTLNLLLTMQNSANAKPGMLSADRKPAAPEQSPASS